MNLDATIGSIVDTGSDDIVCLDNSGVPVEVNEDDVNTEIARLQAAHDALAYVRNRELEYPTIAELTISLFDADDKAALVTKRAAVKTKWPKDNSGPIA